MVIKKEEKRIPVENVRKPSGYSEFTRRFIMALYLEFTMSRLVSQQPERRKPDCWSSTNHNVTIPFYCIKSIYLFWFLSSRHFKMRRNIPIKTNGTISIPIFCEIMNTVAMGSVLVFIQWNN